MIELQELTRWGQAGWAVSLNYGMTMQDDDIVYGWGCYIGARTIGSVTIGLLDGPSFGYHPTDPIHAARIALRQAGERWPEMVREL